MTLGVQTHLGRLALLSCLTRFTGRSCRVGSSPTSALPDAQRAAALSPPCGAAPAGCAATATTTTESTKLSFSSCWQRCAAAPGWRPPAAVVVVAAAAWRSGWARLSWLASSRSTLRGLWRRSVPVSRARRGETIDARAAEAEKTAARDAMRDWYAQCAAWDASGVCDSELEALLGGCPAHVRGGASWRDASGAEAGETSCE